MFCVLVVTILVAHFAPQVFIVPATKVADLFSSDLAHSFPTLTQSPTPHPTTTPHPKPSKTR